MLCQQGSNAVPRGCRMPAAAMAVLHSIFELSRERFSTADLKSRCMGGSLLSLFLELIAVDRSPRQPAIGCAE